MFLEITGIPDECVEVEKALFRSRIDKAYQELSKRIGNNPTITAGWHREQPSTNKDNDLHQKDLDERDKNDNLLSIAPHFSFDQLILPKQLLDEIKIAIQVLSVESIVFDQWGLRKIEPNPKTSLNFYGPPGTGKTMAAHAIASFLEKRIIVASYAEIESKYHGDGPKNVKALFKKAEDEKALLFIDEADSLLSKRLTNVTQGSEQAINSMRSQLLINLEQFSGIVLFSTNLVCNYDKAFESRIKHIQFSLPDQECREKIWSKHLLPTLPLDSDVSIQKLGIIDNVCGRDIRNAVIQAAVKAALNQTIIKYSDLEDQITSLKNARIQENSPQPQQKELSMEEKEKMSNSLKSALHINDEANQ